jgi:integrase
MDTRQRPGDPAVSSGHEAITVGLLGRSYLAHLAAKGRSLGYQIGHEGRLRNHVVPAIGHKALGEWTIADSERLLGGLRARLEPRTIQSVGQLLRGLVTHAHKEGLAPRDWDPMFRVSYSARSLVHGAPVHQVQPEEIPSGEAVEALAAAFCARGWPEWGLAVRLCAQSGLRWGELVGLTAGDVSVARRQVIVARSIAQARGALYEKVPKSGTRRTTIFYESLAAPLEHRIGELGPRSGALLFPGAGGRWAERSAFRRGRFIPAARLAGWAFEHGRPPYNWLSLRHFAATTMLYEVGLDLSDVAHFLGHADPAFTLRTYVDCRPRIYDRAFEMTRGR